MEAFSHNKECSAAVFLIAEMLKKCNNLSSERIRSMLLKLLHESAIQNICSSKEQFCFFLQTHLYYFEYDKSSDLVCSKQSEPWSSKSMEKEALNIIKSRLQKREYILLCNLHSFFDPILNRDVFKYIRSRGKGGSGITTTLIALLVCHINEVLICGEKVQEISSELTDALEICDSSFHINMSGVICYATPLWGAINTEGSVKIGKVFVDKRLSSSNEPFAKVFPMKTSVVFDCVSSPPGRKFEWQATYISCNKGNKITLNNSSVQINEELSNPPSEAPGSQFGGVANTIETNTCSDDSVSSEESSDEKQFLLGKSGIVTLVRYNVGLFEIETIVNFQTELVCCPFKLGKHISVGNSVVFDAESTPESHLYKWKAIKVYTREDKSDNDDDDGTAATLKGGNVSENSEIHTSEVEVSCHIHETTEEMSVEQRDINYNIQNGEIFDVKTNYGIIIMNQPHRFVYFDRRILDGKIKVGQKVKVKKTEKGSPLVNCKWTATDFILIQDYDENDDAVKLGEQSVRVNAYPVDRVEIIEKQIQENENDNVTSELVEHGQRALNAENLDGVVSCDSLKEDDSIIIDTSHLSETERVEDDKKISFETNHDTNNQEIHLISQESLSTHYDDTNPNDEVEIPLYSKESLSTQYEHDTYINDEAEISQISQETSSTHHEDAKENDDAEIHLVSKETQSSNYGETNTNDDDDAEIAHISQESPSNEYDDTNTNDEVEIPLCNQEFGSTNYDDYNKNDDAKIAYISQESQSINYEDNNINGGVEIDHIFQKSPGINYGNTNTNEDEELPLVSQETRSTNTKEDAEIAHTSQESQSTNDDNNTNDNAEIPHISQESPSPDYDGIDTNDDASSIESTYQPNSNLDHLDENENVIVAFINENFVLYYNRLVSFIEEKLNRYPSIKRMLSWFKGECEKLEDWEPYSYSQTVMDNPIYTSYQEKITFECFVAITDTINSCKTSSVIQLDSSIGANQSSVRTFNKEIQTEKYKKQILIDCGTQTSELTYIEDQSVSLLQPCERNSNCKEAAVQTRSSGAIMSTVFSE